MDSFRTRSASRRGRPKAQGDGADGRQGGNRQQLRCGRKYRASNMDQGVLPSSRCLQQEQELQKTDSPFMDGKSGAQARRPGEEEDGELQLRDRGPCPPPAAHPFRVRRVHGVPPQALEIFRRPRKGPPRTGDRYGQGGTAPSVRGEAVLALDRRLHGGGQKEGEVPPLLSPLPRGRAGPVGEARDTERRTHGGPPSQDRGRAPAGRRTTGALAQPGSDSLHGHAVGLLLLPGGRIGLRRPALAGRGAPRDAGPPQTCGARKRSPSRCGTPASWGWDTSSRPSYGTSTPWTG